MLYLAICLFVLAAVLGIVLLFNVVVNKTPPSRAIFLHGVLATAGILSVIYYTIENDLDDPWLVLSMFILAALGGITLFILQLRKQALPKIMTIIHPIVAAIALLSLVAYAFK